MGMYTELVLKCEVRRDVPGSVEAVLQFLFNGADEPAELPAHIFFKCIRWRSIGRGASFYHTPFALSRYDTGFDPPEHAGGYIFSRSDLKNYESEIEKFLNWLDPYLDGLPGECIGWSWYEENTEPTLIHQCPQPSQVQGE